MSIRNLILLGILNLIAVLLLFVLFEGFASVIFVAYEVLTKNDVVAEGMYTKYDEMLGWVSRPSVRIEDMYGTGVYVEINKQRFRDSEEFTRNVPAGRTRIICSGDSFTFGYGVDNSQTWCQQLESINDTLQTVNMGQGGYGLDQAYLWYKQDGVEMDHDIHIVAFITDDFYRMTLDQFVGYGKPVLHLDGGKLVVKNVPVPRSSSFEVWWDQARHQVLKHRSIKLLRKLFLPSATYSVHRNFDVSGDKELQNVVMELFGELHKINESKSSLLVAVYLPVQGDYVSNESDSWREFFHGRFGGDSLIYIDLVDKFRELPPASINEMFIQESVLDYRGGEGHYTVKGNTFIARTLYAELLASDRLSAVLEH